MLVANVLFKSPESRHSLTASEAHLSWFEERVVDNLERIDSHLSSRQFEDLRSDRRSLTRPGTPARPLIAVVDDEPVIAITLAEILGRHGLRAVWFTIPLDALAFFQSCKVDLLLTDVAMPTMDGICLAAEMLKTHPECSVFFFSSQSHEAGIRRRVHLLSPNVHLEAKPLQVNSLIHGIEQLLTKA
ncbi:CheY-like chemotaxis protein [Granulicella aggregans]|jgi:CheY-like chemotaxis protein|uniref:CheY-like chemotaxis protein n=1 Tax=Granulicella aggregans TaxID=474949 RepID=A0A7W7ZGV9_9BACT|nr:response regulator [Granulicella aggregans]MBB5059695.1 CheY-like chemotaxis protein [Granulicella aggregans]